MIRADETEIICKWIAVNGRVVGDDACERIKLLTKEYLEKIGISWKGGGWETLFRDPKDGRFWMRTYPQSEMHGGGPASLICLTDGEAQARFPDVFLKS
jgi:hypothetical protein